MSDRTVRMGYLETVGVDGRAEVFADAACLGRWHEFDEAGERPLRSTALGQQRERLRTRLRTVCAECPALATCSQYAADTGASYVFQAGSFWVNGEAVA